ncbi:hypothetical protein Tco_1345176 [Tanacetum coccineum]
MSRCLDLVFASNSFVIADIMVTRYQRDIAQDMQQGRDMMNLCQRVTDRITILKTNTPYPSRKIRRIRACTHQRPQKIKDQYAVSRGLNTPYSRYGINIIFWKISNVVPTPRNPQYAVSNPLDTPY